MIDETGKFIEENDDATELVDLRTQSAERLAKVDTLKDIKPPQLEMPCLECKGGKIMDYAIFRPAPWYDRIFGVVILKTELTAVPCRRCKGTGVEKMSPVDSDAATA